MLKMEIGACKNAKTQKKKKKCKKKKKNQIPYLPIFSCFWYFIFECISSPKKQTSFVLQFILG